MSGPPESVTIGPFTYRVSTDEIDVAQAKVAESSNCIGRFDSQHELIVLDPDQSHGSSVDTILHEVIHALTHMTGLSQDLSAQDEERVCTRLAPALLDTLRRNPALVAFLVGEPS